GYEEYEKLGLVQYIDTYSKSMGAEASDPNTTYIDEPTDYQAILKAVDARAAEWKKKYPTYRLAFRSVSTLIAYLDPTTTFKFLQPFVGRRKRDKAVAFYVIEKGMHEEQEIPREDDRLRDAIRHDHGVNLLGDLGRHLAPGGPAFHERPRVAFPQQVPFDLDEADDGLGGVVVRREAEVDGGLAVPEFGDEGDGTVVVHSQVQPAVRRLHEAAAVHTGEFERLDRHRFAASNEPTLCECSRKRGF